MQGKKRRKNAFDDHCLHTAVRASVHFYLFPTFCHHFLLVPALRCLCYGILLTHCWISSDVSVNPVETVALWTPSDPSECLVSPCIRAALFSLSQRCRPQHWRCWAVVCNITHHLFGVVEKVRRALALAFRINRKRWRISGRHAEFPPRISSWHILQLWLHKATAKHWLSLPLKHPRRSASPGVRTPKAWHRVGDVVRVGESVMQGGRNQRISSPHTFAISAHSAPLWNVQIPKQKPKTETISKMEYLSMQMAYLCNQLIVFSSCGTSRSLSLTQSTSLCRRQQISLPL